MIHYINKDNMKTLKRNTKKGAIGGVCAGLGDYLNTDPLMLRLAFVFTFLWAGFGILPYIILWLLIPDGE